MQKGHRVASDNISGQYEPEYCGTGGKPAGNIEDKHDLNQLNSCSEFLSGKKPFALSLSKGE